MLSLEEIKQLAIKYEEEVGPAVHHFVHYVEKEFDKLLARHPERAHHHHHPHHHSAVEVPTSVTVEFK